MSQTIDILLLLALPASGKSEIRRYLDHLGTRRGDLHLGPTVQLDDYPYVHIMRRISEEQRALGKRPAFFASQDSPFIEPRDWLTLIHLVNEDFDHLEEPDRTADAGHLIDRLEAARADAGVPLPIAGDERSELERALAPDAAALADGLPGLEPSEDATIVIEFARGGPAGATPPLPAPFGYQHSLAALAPEILSRAAILYVWVTPEESRRRNLDRAVPGRDGDASILHHGVPEEVMLGDYGMDDMSWLAGQSPRPGTIAVDAGGRTHHLPFARFDNREDQTSFLRDEPSTWPAAAVERLHAGLAEAVDAIRGVDSDAAE